MHFHFNGWIRTDEPKKSPLVVSFVTFNYGLMQRFSFLNFWIIIMSKWPTLNASECVRVTHLYGMAMHWMNFWIKCNQFGKYIWNVFALLIGLRTSLFLRFAWQTSRRRRIVRSVEDRSRVSEFRRRKKTSKRNTQPIDDIFQYYNNAEPYINVFEMVCRPM